MTAATFVDYYEILQIPETADTDQIKAAVSQQRRVWIKRQASADPKRRGEAETRVRNIDEAERTLLNAGQRTAYDRRLPEQRKAAPEAAPPDGEADWLDRARAYLEMGNPGAAHRAAREATNQRGGDHGAWFVRAHSSFLLGQAADAEFEFAEAIRIAPEEPDYHQDLGEVYAQQEKYAQAMREFEIALRQAPGNPVTRTAIAQVQLATDEPHKALKIMEAVVKEHPDNDFFKYYLGAALESSARASITLLRDGTIIVTSEAQAALLEKHARRILKLNLKDKDAAEAVAELQRLADTSREMMWVHSGAWQVYAFVLAASLCGLCGGIGSGDGGAVAGGIFLGGGIAAAVVAIYVTRHRKPAYEHAAKHLTGQVVRWGK
ncbi:tetratricopeptide repeat protein [Dactylosporangium sp. NPDC051541]|uniref:tetratricopeptide repeat protein n=1 Tax=Dactylosporangium sp. NPDC051541 TaxID=3363977 RepID=UPI0037A2819A